ncbi:acyltransferase family protein [Chryseolinea soli]|uniref:Acyltransferase n=1 Tax=Chryseolinea soli TaxID=2321403 RepID=A0A385SLG4_9BACT|nr:acyltransferase [Chryseolinea soli]AYB31652.1 acyltransferase [Chryseolinea soli]
MTTTDSLTAPKRYFSNLDGLRFVLAMVVFFAHSRLGVTLISVIPFDFVKRLVSVFSNGGLGVSFFFTLSGYLITYLIIEEKETSGAFHIRNFYIRRALRIWPLYYATLLFTFFIYPIIKVKLGYPNENPYHFLYQLLFLGNFDSIQVHQFDLVGLAPMMIGINWSIGIEEQFYIFWPVLFLLFRGRRFWIAITLVIVSSFFLRTFVLQGPALYYHTFSRMSDLAVGGLLGYLSYYNKTFVTRMEQMPRWVVCVIYASGFLLLMYGTHTVDSTVVSLFFGFVIVDQNFAKRSFYKFGDHKLLSSLGKYSYSLYLLHPIGIQASILIFRFSKLDPLAGFFYGVLYALIALIASMALSMLSYRFIESYFLNLRKKFY